MITLRQLRYLAALSEHRHFGRAAEACAVTQPAMSMQVRDLERTLGVTLVERRPSDIVLTEIGRDIARRGTDLLAGARDLVDAARHGQRLLTGPLRLGVIPSLAPYLLPRLLPRLQSLYPDLRLSLRETQTQHLMAEIGDGSLDAALLALPAGGADIATLAVFHDPFVLCVANDDPRRAMQTVTPESLDPSTLLLLEDGHCLRDQALAVCGAPYAQRSANFGASSLATIVQMVGAGYGVTLVPQIAAEQEGRAARVKFLHFRKPAPGREIGLAFRRTSPRAPDFDALKNVIRSVAMLTSPQAEDVS